VPRPQLLRRPDFLHAPSLHPCTPRARARARWCPRDTGGGVQPARSRRRARCVPRRLRIAPTGTCWGPKPLKQPPQTPASDQRRSWAFFCWWGGFLGAGFWAKWADSESGSHRRNPASAHNRWSKSLRIHRYLTFIPAVGSAIIFHSLNSNDRLSRVVIAYRSFYFGLTLCIAGCIAVVSRRVAWGAVPLPHRCRR